ncbi:MAG: hypothetical protein RB191_13550 [Terriglobia bacterium]|nr:hypothetical protein [Terriglobia bacterium]
MPTCFVIQPFDSGKFDKRFEQIYKPAILAAGLEPYRVDQDIHVDIPIESIEAGIRAASVCLADLTTDNPNVWYELGFSFAAGTPVAMVCSTEREGKKFPFDIQHRSVIRYSTDAPEDFDVLREKITARVKALLEKGATLQQLAEADQVAPVAGLSQPELTVLAVLAGSVGTPDGEATLFSVQQDSERASLTKLGFALGLRRLSFKNFVQTTEGRDDYGNSFDVLKVTDAGWDWIEANEANFVLRRSAEAARNDDPNAITDDDIPF